MAAWGHDGALMLRDVKYGGAKHSACTSKLGCRLNKQNVQMRPIKGRSVADGSCCHAGDGGRAQPFGSKRVMMFTVLISNHSISLPFCMCMLFIFLFFLQRSRIGFFTTTFKSLAPARN